MELKDVFEALGIEAVDSKDKFLESFRSKYYTAEQAKETLLGEIVGKKFTKAKQNMLNKAREEGIEFTQSEFENKTLEEVHYELAQRKANGLSSKITELEAKVGQSGEEVVKEWREKAEKAAKRADEEAALRKALASEFDGFKTTAATAQKSIKLDYFKNEELKKIKEQFKKVSELEIEGFESRINKNYKCDFDDQGNPFATDATGNRIRSADKADQFMTYSDVLALEAKKLNLFPENPNAGKPVTGWKPPAAPVQPFAPVAGQPPVNPAPNQGRRVNPKYDNF